MSRRVVHVLSSFKVGGAERFVFDLAQVQCEEGHDVAIISCTKDDDLLNDNMKNGFSCRLSLGNRWGDCKSAVRLFSQSKGGIFQLHSPWALRYFLPILPLLRLIGVKVIYTRHGLNPLVGNRWSIEHFFANPWVNTVTFVSQAGLEVFRERFGWSQDKMVMISNGVFVPKVIKSKSSAKIRLGSVGRMVKLKGQIDLVEAVSNLDSSLRQRLELHFYGDGPELEFLKMRAKKICNPCDTCFHGMVLNRDDVYENIDILVVNSEQEGLSLAIMEAMARGIPVIATRVGDSPKLVINEFTGFLYEYNDVNRLMQLLLELCSDRDLIRELGVNARNHIMENFSLEKSSECYLRCFQD